MQILLIFFVLFTGNIFLYADPSSSSSRIKVDGISANTRVVIANRHPVFSWDFTYDTGSDQDNVHIQIGTAADQSDVWDFSDIIYVTYQQYNGTAVLQDDTTYYWRIQITDTEGRPSPWISSTFHTVRSAVSLSSDQADLKIDWNNPFNPYRGQITNIVYQLHESNETIAVRVYTINGELVKTLAEHLGQRHALYTVEWDGRNAEGTMVASGVYLVNLKAGSSIDKTRRVVVIK